jgi:hypothetical protein
MDEKTTAAVANLREAAKDYPRGTKRHKPRARGVHEQWGALVPVMVGDLTAAIESVPAERRCKSLAEMISCLSPESKAKFPPEMVVTVCADDLFDLLDLAEKSP